MIKRGKTSILIAVTILIGILFSTGCSLPFTTAGTPDTQPVVQTPIFVTPTSATGPTVIVVTPLPQDDSILTAEAMAHEVAATDTPTPEMTATETTTPTVTGTVSPYLGSHTVQSGESLYSIGRAYGVDPNAIAQANGIGTPYTIYKGQALKIPPVKWTSIPSGPVAPQQFTPNWDAVGEYNYVIPTLIVRPYYPSSH